jgi:hypothetical protein
MERLKVVTACWPFRAEHAPSAEIDSVQICHDLRDRSSEGLIDICASQPALRQQQPGYDGRSCK